MAYRTTENQNFHDQVIIGVDLIIIPSNVIDKPSITPSRFISKSKI